MSQALERACDASPILMLSCALTRALRKAGTDDERRRD
jgi:hypothetical protein